MYIKPLTRRGKNGIMILGNVEMILEVEFYENMKRLISHLMIKIIIATIIILILMYITALCCPDPKQSNLYEVNGICIDAYYEKSTKSSTLYYINMDNGTTYLINRDMLRYVNVSKIQELKGRDLTFLATDRIIFTPTVVAWNDADEIRETTLALTREQISESRTAMMIIYLFLGLVFLTPSILRITQKRDQIKDAAWRKKKREAEKQRFAEKQLESNGSSKKRPQNMSEKRWKKRRKR